LQTAFDYSIKSSEPKSLDTENKNWEISLVVSALANKNMDFCANYCIKTLGALSLTNDEVKNYKILNKTVFPIVINYNGVNRRFYLRREESIHVLNSFIHNWKFYTRLFAVQSGMDKSNSNNSIEKIYDFKGKFSEVDFSLVFLTKGQLAATFSWQDERTLSQIEEMNGYTVRPTGIKSYIKFGGYVVYEKDGHGLVASIIDLKQMNRNLATIACDNLVFNGYSDWHLPSRDELSSIYENLHLLGIGGFRNKYYCSSIQEFSSIKWDQDFSNGVNEYNNEQEFYNIRPVRIF
jgi:hypothetical protein